MDLLPKVHDEFRNKSYWDTFFKRRGNKAFEWYGEYLQLFSMVHKYIKYSDNVLVVGCGNSQLSADMYDGGYHSITNIDISDIVIRQMTKKNEKIRPNMKFLKMNVNNMDFEEDSFSTVIDKGTLDALMVDDSDIVADDVTKMFNEIARVIRVGGRYIIVTLAQKHILQKLVSHFCEMKWPIRVHRLEEHDDQSEFHMPVFVFVLTKFKKMENMPQILEVSYFEDKIDRVRSEDKFMKAVKEIQTYGLVKQSLAKCSVEEHLSFDLYTAESDIARYTFYVVDGPNSMNKFAIFIVPQGRETEWMFSTDQGRKHLAVTAGFQRLVVVTLHRGHVYVDMENIKSELSQKVMDMKPIGLAANAQVPFLTEGSDIGERKVQFQGRSAFSGDFIVEDVKGVEMVRQLIFLSNKNVVQSVATLIKVTTGKKSKKKCKLVPDRLHPGCSFHVSMIAGLAFLKNAHDVESEDTRVLVVGLGGGSLPLFLHLCFSKISIEVVELDPAIVAVAKCWFGFEEDELMKVYVEDGIDYINRAASSGHKYDAIMFDVDNKDTSSVGLRCPAACFIEDSFLQTVACVLGTSGILIINFLCRDLKRRSKVLSDLKTKYACVFIAKVPDDGNEIIFATQADNKAEAIYERLSVLDITAKRDIPGKFITSLAKSIENLEKLT